MRLFNRALLFKCVNDAWWLFAALALLLFSFCWLRVWIVSLIEMSRFTAILQPIFDKYSHLSPVPFSHVTTYPGRVALTFVEPVVVFGLSIWAIARGSDIVSGEVGRGTMEMLLGQPLSRLQVFVTQAWVTVLGAGLLCAVSWLGLWIGIHRTQVKVEQPLISFSILGGEEEPEFKPLSEEVQASTLLPGVVNLFAMVFCVAGLTTLISSCDRYRWRTIGIAAGIYILQFIIKGLAISAESLQWMKSLSFFTAFEPQWYVFLAVERPESVWAWTFLEKGSETTELGALGFNAILFGIGAICYVAGAFIFCKRDLPAPL